MTYRRIFSESPGAKGMPCSKVFSDTQSGCLALCGVNQKLLPETAQTERARMAVHAF